MPNSRRRPTAAPRPATRPTTARGRTGHTLRERVDAQDDQPAGSSTCRDPRRCRSPADPIMSWRPVQSHVDHDRTHPTGSPSRRPRAVVLPLTLTGHPHRGWPHLSAGGLPQLHRGHRLEAGGQARAQRPGVAGRARRDDDLALGDERQRVAHDVGARRGPWPGRSRGPARAARPAPSRGSRACGRRGAAYPNGRDARCARRWRAGRGGGCAGRCAARVRARRRVPRATSTMSRASIQPSPARRETRRGLLAPPKPSGPSESRVPSETSSSTAR